MNTNCCSPGAGPATYLPSRYQFSSTSQAAVNVQTNAGISLVTADGDKVTLSANTSTQASLQTYNYLGQLDGQTLAAQGAALQITANSGYSLSVQGSLDEDELKDINKLLNTLASARKQFFAGNAQAGLQQLSQIDKLDAIASFEANFSYSLQASVTNASRVALPTADATVPKPQNDATTTASEGPDINSFLDQLASAAKQLRHSDHDDKIPKRFVQLLNKLAKDIPLDANDLDLAQRLRAAQDDHGQSRHDDRAQAEDVG